MTSIKQRLQTIRRQLHRRADNPRENFIWLLCGFSLFMLGLMVISIAQFLLTDSVTAELVALLGLIFMISGGGLAIAGYLGLSVLRILRFLDSDDDKPSRH